MVHQLPWSGAIFIGIVDHADCGPLPIIERIPGVCVSLVCDWVYFPALKFYFWRRPGLQTLVTIRRLATENR
jgi:hypothetical protein